MSSMAQKSPESSQVATLRKSASERETEHRAVRASGTAEAVLALQQSVGNRAVGKLLRGSLGRPLDRSTRREMEEKFGADFGDVRVHTDACAAEVALGVGARAVTLGRNIAFTEGFYAPGRSEGKRLIAHELAHVIQQGQSGGRRVSAAGAESEARQAGSEVVAGRATSVQAAASGAQADPLTDEEKKKAQQNATSEPVKPFDPQAGNWFAKWLLYGKDTPIRDALTNDNNLKAAQDTAMAVTIVAGTIATGGLLAEAAAGAGVGTIGAGAIGGAGSSAASVAAKSAYKGKMPTAQEAITEVGIGTLTGGVGAGVTGSLTSATTGTLGKIAAGAVGGGAAAGTGTLAQAAISGKAPTAEDALLDVGKGALMGGGLSATDSAIGALSGGGRPSTAPQETAPVTESPAAVNEVTGGEPVSTPGESAGVPASSQAVKAGVPEAITPVTETVPAAASQASEAPPVSEAAEATQALENSMTVDPDIDAMVEQGIIEEPVATYRPTPRSRPKAPAQRGAAAEAREEFSGELRGEYAEDLGVEEGGQVHHATELQTLDKYPDVFTEAELNAPENMRGIPPELQGRRQLHNAKIREVIDRHYRALDREIDARGLTPDMPEYKVLVRDWMGASQDLVDWSMGDFFSENRAGSPAAAAAAPATSTAPPTASNAVSQTEIPSLVPESQLESETAQTPASEEISETETTKQEEPAQRLRIDLSQPGGIVVVPPENHSTAAESSQPEDSGRVRVDTESEQPAIDAEEGNEELFDEDSPAKKYLRAKRF